MASKFLNDEEFELIQKMMESKGLPKFHLIAFNTEDMDIPRYLMASGFSSYHDMFTFQAIVTVLLEQLNVMCKALQTGEVEMEGDTFEITGNPKGNC